MGKYKQILNNEFRQETVNESFEGETIEQKVARVVELNEPITDGAPLIYTDKKDGVVPAYDIRTDKWDIAVDAMGVVYKNAPTPETKNSEESKIDLTERDKGTTDTTV